MIRTCNSIDRYNFFVVANWNYIYMYIIYFLNLIFIISFYAYSSFWLKLMLEITHVYIQFKTKLNKLKQK